MKKLMIIDCSELGNDIKRDKLYELLEQSYNDGYSDGYNDSRNIVTINEIPNTISCTNNINIEKEQPKKRGRKKKETVQVNNELTGYMTITHDISNPIVEQLEESQTEHITNEDDSWLENLI